MKQVDVAIGIVFRGRDLLICQRRAGGTFADFWEFPGGKIEAGESPELCVVRELREELNIEVEPTRALDVICYTYPAFAVRLHPFICRMVSGTPSPIECQQVLWVRSDELSQYPFPDANRSLLDKLIAMNPNVL
ncbi:MAG TPA: 8-oxo-dGTP diphosphatase MutT [Tepidisphaeraceae bacterium]|nr:8-oxo-dGTP diphosphatase MutT [Tepidisphaeraceae bacterium]